MSITFFDMFAGIGGFRLALERLGWRCVGWCEADEWCQKTYRANFDTSGDWFWPDAATMPVGEMPDFDVLCAGFPCQSFSTAGRKGGFEDARGTLVYEVFRVLDAKRPRAFLLENVKGLACRPFRDREFKYILRTLAGLGYQVFWRVLDSRDFGVPQHRERVYIVGFREGRFRDFPWPEPVPPKARLADVLEKEVPAKYRLSGRLVYTLARLAAGGRPSGRGRYDTGMSRPEIGEALRVYGDGGPSPPLKRHPLLVATAGFVRRLTPRECARLQGFPDSFAIPVSDTQAYRQFGNAVTVPVVEAIGRRMEAWLRDGEEAGRLGRCLSPA